VDKIALLEAVAQRWNREGIPYAVAHGIEGYPNHVGRDLDVLVGSGHARRAIELAQDVLEHTGLTVVRPPRLWGERLVAAALDPEPDLLEVHALDGVSWRWGSVTGEPHPSLSIGPFGVDPWVRFAKRILMPVLAADHRKLLGELERYPADALETAAAREHLPALMGAPLADAFQRAVQTRDEEAITELIPLVRRAVARHLWAAQPLAALRHVVRGLWRRAAQPFSPCGPVICIVGPPGSGKSALQEAICRGERFVFTRCHALRWTAPRATAATWMSHAVQLARELVRGVIRSLITDRLYSSRQQLVVYEGCALDLVVNPRRFGLRSSFAARLCWQILPKPDLIIVLDGPDQVICGRNPGLSVEQLRDEQAAWRSVMRTTSRMIALPADRPLDELRVHATKLIVQAFVRKNSGMPRGRMRATRLAG
jgi:adenylate kinase family enzyme